MMKRQTLTEMLYALKKMDASSDPATYRQVIDSHLEAWAALADAEIAPEAFMPPVSADELRTLRVMSRSGEWGARGSVSQTRRIIESHLDALNILDPVPAPVDEEPSDG